MVKNMSLLYIFSIWLMFLKFNVAREIPEYIHVCQRNDPNVAKCVRESVEVLRPYLKTGIPEINVPSIEPLNLRSIVIFRGDEGSNLKASLKNVNIFGFSNFEIQKLKLDVERNTYRVDVKFPVLDLEGEYDVDIRLLAFPIKGTGNFAANATNCEARCIIRGEIIERDGIRQLSFKSANLKIRFDDYDVQLKSLFNGDPVLTQAANEIVNSNKRDFIPLATPFIERKASEIILDLASSVTDGLPYDEIFPDK